MEYETMGKSKILVITVSEKQLEIYQDLMRANGLHEIFDLTFAWKPEEAIAKAKDEQFDLIIMEDIPALACGPDVRQLADANPDTKLMMISELASHTEEVLRGSDVFFNVRCTPSFLCKIVRLIAQ